MMKDPNGPAQPKIKGQFRHDTPGVVRGWIGPWLLVGLILFAVSEGVAAFTFRLGEWLDGPAINVQHWGSLGIPHWSARATIIWTIIWTLVGFTLAAAAAIPVFRKHHRPVLLAFLASLPTAVFFIIGSDNLQWDPLGEEASAIANTAALITLWGVLWIPMLVAWGTATLRMRRAE